MGEIIGYVPRPSDATAVPLDELVLELGLSVGLVWRIIALRTAMREERGEAARDPRDDALEVLGVCRTPSAIIAAAAAVGRRRGRARLPGQPSARHRMPLRAQWL